MGLVGLRKAFLKPSNWGLLTCRIDQRRCFIGHFCGLPKIHWRVISRCWKFRSLGKMAEEAFHVEIPGNDTIMIYNDGRDGYLAGRFKYFVMFTPKPWGNDPKLTSILFRWVVQPPTRCIFCYYFLIHP